MIISLQEAINILNNELGCDPFTETGAVNGSGTFSTVGISSTLEGDGTGDLTDFLEINDLLVIDQVSYRITSVSTGELEIAGEIELTEAKWQYVKVEDSVQFLKDQKRRQQSLNVSTRIIESNTCETDPIPESKKLATALLACRYYEGYSSDVNNSNILSEKIGDISTSYDRSKLVEPIPKDIIDILGDCYIGGAQPSFFTK
jgi:hypothetical protein